MSGLTPKQNRERLDNGLTDYEVGNHILHNICDAMSDFASELEKRNPGKFSKLQEDLRNSRNDFNEKYARPLMGSGACS